MSKKLFSPAQLQTLTPAEIVDKINHENYSLLKTFHKDNLLREMLPVGAACNAAIDYVLGTTGPRNNPAEHIKNARAKLVKRLSVITPGKYEGFPKDSDKGLVVGFNHPSLGEIARILMMKMDVMGDKPMLFPVNLPWYESIAKDYDRILSLGIIITPMITPSTWLKLELRKGTSEFEAGSKLKHGFKDLYMELCRKTMKDGGVIFVAPSAGRQATVFKNKEVYDRTEPIIPTMSVLALDLLKDKDVNCDFMPMSIVPPDNYGRKLNFFKPYKLIPGQIFTADEVRKKYYKKGASKLPDFDYDFHQRIADNLPHNFWF